MLVRVEEIHQKLDEQLSADVNLDPKYVQQFFTSNLVQRVLAYLFGWNYLTREPQKVSVTSDGSLRVAVTATALEHYSVHKGTAGDEWTLILFPYVVARVDVWIKDAGAVIDHTLDGELWDGEIDLDINSFYSFDCKTKAIRVKNKVSGQNAYYQIVGWY